MAESKVDLPEDLGPVNSTVEPWVAKGNDAGKVLMGFLDESKDQATSENSIPLSPQWLYAKPSESKAGLSTASGDTRPVNSLPQGTSLDSVHKDAWRLDGSQDKKEWRRNVPDVEINRRWREEERDTGLLGRRERRKEGDRENEFRKNDRRSENISVRETADSRTLPSSDRWHEVSSRNSGNENRRDSKWSSRWGPEDKEKESRMEKKMDVEKEDPHIEKQSFVGGNRPLPESDSREKWRPRHRQEVHSGGSAVYRAAPGFGVERGRAEGSNVGFAPGRGRSNFIGGLPFSRSSSVGPIGAAPIVKTESLHGMSSLSADTFRYPRGKLLDIYKKHKMHSPFDTNTKGFEDVPSITQLCSITPLAFVKPDPEEEAALVEIWKVKVASNEVCYDSNREKMAGVNDCKIEPDSDIGEYKDKVNALSNGMDPGGITSIASKDEAVCVPVSLTHSVQRVHQANVENDDELLGHPDFSNDAMFGAVNSTASIDVSNNLTDGSNFLHDTSFIQERPSYNSQHQNINSEIELQEQGTRGELINLSLYYCDPQGEIQGPFLVEDIISWYDEGYFGTDLPVCLSDASEGMPFRLSDASEGMPFRPLGEVFPNLSLRPQSNPLVNPGEQLEPSDNIRGNLDESTLASEFSSSFATKGQQWASSGSEGPFNLQVQPIISENEDSVNSRYEKLPLSSSEISLGITGPEGQSSNDFSGQDSGDVLYTGKPLHDPSLNSGGHQYLMSEMGEANYINQNLPTDYDLNPLGLSWSELERTHQKGPLSSNISGVGDQCFNPFLGGDGSLFRHNQEEFSLKDDPSVVRDAWSSNYRRNPSSNALQDAMDGSHLSRFEPESARFNLEEHLLHQQFQNQQLQQQRLLSPHQNLHLTGSFLDQLQGSVHHQQSINQSIPDMEHLLKLQFEQQRHLQQLEQQQQMHQQQQQMHQQHQMQLRQQQLQQQQQQHQLRLEQLLHQQLHDPTFGASHVDHLLGENSIDHVLYRQRLHELQQQAHHLPRNHDSLDQIIQAKFGRGLHHEHHNEILDALSRPSHRHMSPLEQQLLIDLQQEQLQARQFSIASRHQTGMEEERHVGGLWSVDESGQFIRAAATPHQTHSSRLGQLDYIQPSHRSSSTKQPSHLERNYALHGHLQQGNYEPNVLPFERYAGAPGLDMDQLNALTRIQGMEIQEQHGQMSQFPSGNRSHQLWMSNEPNASHMSAMERNWPDPNGQLRNSMIESQFTQLNLAAEKQKRDIKANFSSEDPNQWASLVGNDENSNHGLANLFHQKLALQSAQSLGLVNGAPTSSYENRDSSWLASPLATDHPINFVADTVGLSDSFTEGSRFAKLGQAHERSVNVNSEGKVNNFEGTGRLALRSNSGALLEHQQFFSDMGEFEREQFADSMVGDGSRDLIDFSEGMMVKKRGSKGLSISRSALDNLEGGIEHARASVIDHGNLKIDVPARHASFGSAGGGAGLYNYEMGSDNVYIDEMVKDRMSGMFSQGTDSSLSKRTHDLHILSSQGALPELVPTTTQMRGKNLSSFPYYEEGRRNPGGNLALQVPETPSSSNKDVRFRRTPSYGDANAPEASFIDMLKSTKKPAPEADASAGAAESADAGSGVRSSKKKGKKGRQIDPSLLGFKVHSNRILMGEIHRPDDS